MIAVMCFGTLTAFAAVPRVDVAAKNQLKLTPLNNEETMFMKMQTWGAEETRPYRFTAEGKKVGENWETVRIRFKAENDGAVILGLAGQWARKPELKEWVMVSHIQVNGKLITNGDFRNFSGSSEKGYKIKNFWLGSKVRYISGGGENGAGAVCINEENRIGFIWKVKAGKIYELSYRVKAAPVILMNP